MSIIDRFKRLISGASAEPVKQVRRPASQNQTQQFLQPSSQQTPQTWPNGDARTLLKEATALKRLKRYDDAVAMLRRAYDAPTECPMMIQERLRLPMYLQLAGRNDEAWDELNRLNVQYVDQFSQPVIANQMRVFLQKEGNEKATNPVRVILQGKNTPMPLSPALERTSVTMGELQNAPVPSWMDDVCSGFKFCATLQLRTPLRVLLRHGELYLKNDGRQPQIAREPWEGIWGMETKSYEEVACGPDSTPEDVEFFRRMDCALADNRTVASAIGPVRPDDYLPLLIAIRKIVELDEPIDSRIKKLREMPMVSDWQTLVSRHGPSYKNESRGMEWIIEYFFPRFIKSIPKISAGMVDELCKLGLDTPNRIAAAPDETLLSIKGIGQAKLKTIRDYCAGISDNRDADRVENVIR